MNSATYSKNFSKTESETLYMIRKLDISQLVFMAFLLVRKLRHIIVFVQINLK